MFEKLRRFFLKSEQEESVNPEDLELASAILLVEVVLADYEKDYREVEMSRRALSKLMQISRSEVDLLLEKAFEKRRASPSI